jgi:ribulose-5-phosphate 4-epimerase/fuculose-1-phosphate aldolase
MDIAANILELAYSSSKYCVGMEGNVSGKINEDSFLIKASGEALSNLKSDGLVEFDFEGNQLTNLNKRGSMELGFHTFLLKFEGVNYVSHTHPVNILKILCSYRSKSFADYRLFPDQVIFNGAKSCLVPYDKPSENLAELVKIHVNLFIKNEGYFPKIILLENHGVIACGNTIVECIVSTEICEKSAEIFIGSLNLGKIKFLTKQQIINLTIDEKEKYRQKQLI